MFNTPQTPPTLAPVASPSSSSPSRNTWQLGTSAPPSSSSSPPRIISSLKRSGSIMTPQELYSARISRARAVVVAAPLRPLPPSPVRMDTPRRLALAALEGNLLSRLSIHNSPTGSGMKMRSKVPSPLNLKPCSTQARPVSTSSLQGEKEEEVLDIKPVDVLSPEAESFFCRGSTTPIEVEEMTPTATQTFFSKIGYEEDACKSFLDLDLTPSLETSFEVGIQEVRMMLDEVPSTTTKTFNGIESSPRKRILSSAECSPSKRIATSASFHSLTSIRASPRRFTRQHHRPSPSSSSTTCSSIQFATPESKPSYQQQQQPPLPQLPRQSTSTCTFTSFSSTPLHYTFPTPTSSRTMTTSSSHHSVTSWYDVMEDDLWSSTEVGGGQQRQDETTEAFFDRLEAERLDPKRNSNKETKRLKETSLRAKKWIKSVSVIRF